MFWHFYPHLVRSSFRAFTNGCFDLLHVGQVKLLREAKCNGDILIVGINSDASIKKIKGPERPIFSQEERCEILSALEMVDFVTVFLHGDRVRVPT